MTEELVFRGCVLSLYQLSGASVSSMVFLSPMSFGAGMSSVIALQLLFTMDMIAHVHHAWEIFNRYGRTAAAAKRAAMICCTSSLPPFFQQNLTMKQLFNSPIQPYSASTVPGSSSARAPYSLPSLPIAFVILWVYLNSLTNCAGSQSEKLVCISLCEFVVICSNDAWFLVILAAYVIGIAAFVYTLKPWTYSKESLYWVRISLESLEDKGGEVQLFY